MIPLTGSYNNADCSSSQEQRRTYKTYAILNTLLFGCAFILAGALIGVSGARHSSAVERCLVSPLSGVSRKRWKADDGGAGSVLR